MSRPIRKRRLKEEDKKLISWLKKGGRMGTKSDLLSLIRKAVKVQSP